MLRADRRRGRPADRQLRQRAAPQSAGGQAPLPRSTGCARASSTCAGSTRCRPRRSGRTPPKSARWWSSTSAAPPAGASPTPSSRTSPSSESEGASARCAPSTRSCRSDRRPRRCSSGSTRSSPPRSPPLAGARRRQRLRESRRGRVSRARLVCPQLTRVAPGRPSLGAPRRRAAIDGWPASAVRARRGRGPRP